MLCCPILFLTGWTAISDLLDQRLDLKSLDDGSYTALRQPLQRLRALWPGTWLFQHSQQRWPAIASKGRRALVVSWLTEDMSCSHKGGEKIKDTCSSVDHDVTPQQSRCCCPQIIGRLCCQNSTLSSVSKYCEEYSEPQDTMVLAVCFCDSARRLWRNCSKHA